MRWEGSCVWGWFWERSPDFSEGHPGNLSPFLPLDTARSARDSWSCCEPRGAGFGMHPTQDVEPGERERGGASDAGLPAQSLPYLQASGARGEQVARQQIPLLLTRSRGPRTLLLAAKAPGGNGTHVSSWTWGEWTSKAAERAVPAPVIPVPCAAVFSPNIVLDSSAFLARLVKPETV